MKKLSLVLLICGLCLVVGGFIYDARFAGIPYQDPTPELQARYDRHAGIAKRAMLAGLVGLVAGGVLAFNSSSK